MRKTWRKIASLLLSLLICLSTTYSPVLAAGDKAAKTVLQKFTVPSQQKGLNQQTQTGKNLTILQKST